MAKVTLVQVGDVHYPDWTGKTYATDDKDKRLSPAVRAGVTHAPMRHVLAKLSTMSQNAATAAVAFMGDFTSRGQAQPLEAAITHLSWLCRADRRRAAAPRLLMVPGNHDVAKADAATLGQIGKFEKMSRIAEANLFEAMPVENHVPVTLEGDGGKIAVFLLNTTLGSWEPYLLPEPLAEAVERDPEGVNGARPLEASIAPAGEASTGLLSYYDQLDTPYVSARSLQSLREAIRETPRSQAVVIVGHHNLLPQEQPRLTNYAEMLNAGYFRRFLLSLDRPVVYLHGHTHRDTVEEIVDPRNPRARIICIAAPMLEDGFNEISFHFDARGSALGLRLLPWRILSDRAAFEPLASNQVAWSLINGGIRPSSAAQRLYDVLVISPDARLNVYDIEENLPTGIQPENIAELLLELFFWRWIEIGNIAAAAEEWIVVTQKMRA